MISLSALLMACIPALLGGIIALGGWLLKKVDAHNDAENTPEMKANAQAKTDEQLMEEAEQAVTAADQGNPKKEQEGDAR